MNLFKFHHFLVYLPHFLLAKQKVFWKEYEHYFKLQEEELSLWRKKLKF